MGITEILDQDRRKSRIAWIGRIAASVALVIAAGSIWLIIQRTPDEVTGRVENPESETRQPENPELKTEQTENPQVITDLQELSTPVQADREILTADAKQESAGSDAGVLARTAGSGDRDREFQEQSQEEIVGYVVINDTPAWGGGMKVTFTGDVMLDRTDVYTLPIDAPEPALILSNRRHVKISPPDEEGIDVFEEFGDEGYIDYDKWAVGGQVAPIYSYRNLGPSQADAMNATSYLNDIESGIVSYAGGVNLNYSPLKRLSIQSGLNYFRLGMSVNDTYIASAYGQIAGMGLSPTELAMSNSSGDIMPGEHKSNKIMSNQRADYESFYSTNTTDVSGAAPTIQQGDLQQNFEYIEIPMILRYRVVDRRAGLNVLGGLSTNFLVGSNVYFQENGSREHIGTTANLKSVNYSSVLGLGFQYSIKPNLHFNMEPTFRYYLNSINSGSGPGSHPYSIGFFTGISYSF